jgi:D-sedoheptulose 7-phosphate isomerase
MENLLSVTISAQLEASRKVVDSLCADVELIAVMEAVARRAAGVLGAGGKILFAGNGGSAADAQHLAAELVGRYAYDRPALAAVALTTDTAAITAIGNDFGFEYVFSRQIEAIARSGDLLIAMSTSGHSPNVVAALETARSRGVITAGLTGGGGGAMAKWCDYLLVMPSNDTPRIQEGHKVVGHIICGLIEQLCCPGSARASVTRD